MRLTNYFIRKRVKKLAEANKKRKNSFCAFEEARHLLVLFNVEDRKVVEPCLDSLRALHKKVQGCVYVATDTVPELDPSYMVIHAKNDLDMWSMPLAEIQRQFCTSAADILIDLTRGENYVMQYLVLKHPGAFKVGAKRDEPDVYDLTISMTKNTDIPHLFKQILFYLQAIRSK